MDVLRTPDERFADLPEFDYAPSYTEVARGDGSGHLRVAYVDAGPPDTGPPNTGPVDTGPVDADPVLLLHGEPSWSFLYRTMIPLLVDAGHRVIAPDLVGFGRSDKPAEINDHTYARHIEWMAELVTNLDLSGLTLFCQDWGGLIGLRLLAEHPERFTRTVAGNTGLPVGNAPMPDVWQTFRNMVVEAPTLDIGRIVASGCVRGLDDAAQAAYDAPFPDERYKAGPRAMPDLIPQRPDDPQSDPNRRAWKVLAELDKPFLVAFSDSDPITAAGRQFLIERVRGAQSLDHPTIEGAGHFLQEDAGPQLAQVIVDFIADTS